MEKAKAAHLGYVGSVPGRTALGRDSDSWYTPQRYIESARAVLGRIDLDPFSSLTANGRVRARRFITAEQDATRTAWTTPSKSIRVWMNPPYSSRLIKAACGLFVEGVKCGRIEAGIVLVNNATDTLWFHELMSEAAAVCFTKGRIAFENFDGKHVSGNTRGQAFVYFGPDAEVFRAEFAKYGCVLKVKA